MPPLPQKGVKELFLTRITALSIFWKEGKEGGKVGGRREEEEGGGQKERKKVWENVFSAGVRIEGTWTFCVLDKVS